MYSSVLTVMYYSYLLIPMKQPFHGESYWSELLLTVTRLYCLCTVVYTPLITESRDPLVSDITRWYVSGDRSDYRQVLTPFRF